MGSFLVVHVPFKLAVDISRVHVNAHVVSSIMFASANSTSLLTCDSPYQLSELSIPWGRRVGIIVVFSFTVPCVHSQITVNRTVVVIPKGIFSKSFGNCRSLSRRRVGELADNFAAPLGVVGEHWTSGQIGSILVKCSDGIGSGEALILECLGGQIRE